MINFVKASGTVRNVKSGRFVISRSYVKRQASEAINTFFAPAAGVYSAVTGERVKIGQVEPQARKRA